MVPAKIAVVADMVGDIFCYGIDGPGNTADNGAIVAEHIADLMLTGVTCGSVTPAARVVDW
jgi:hypothetical protein